VEKYGKAGLTTDDSLAQALRCLGYKDTLRTCNIYCFSAATMVVRTRFIITLYVHCVSCLSWGVFTMRYALSHFVKQIMFRPQRVKADGNVGWWVGVYTGTGM